MSKVIGTNLGDWLVLEKWMEPKNFEGAYAEDETWLARNLSHEELEKRLKIHRDTYVTEEDFAYLEKHHINYVRLPVPYFVFGDREPFIGCIEYVDKAFEWANRHNIKILLDLHTAPHGQNGYDNGGITGVCKWAKHPEEVEFVKTVLVRLAKRYSDNDALYGIELLNEPISWIVYRTANSTGKAVDKEEAKGSSYIKLSFLKKFYLDCYKLLRPILGDDKVIVFHDGFRLTSWKGFFKKNKFLNVVLDTHIYIFALEFFVPINKPWVYKIFLNICMSQIKSVRKYVPIIVGEWCISAKYGSRTSKKGLTEEEWNVKQKDRYRKILKMQIDAWKNTDGWFYWNYQLVKDMSKRLEIEWKESRDFRRCIQHGWINDDDILKSKE